MKKRRHGQEASEEQVSEIRLLFGFFENYIKKPTERAAKAVFQEHII